MKNRKFVTKLILFFVIVSIVPLNVVNLIWSINSIHTLKEQSHASTRQVLNQTKLSLDSAIDSINAISLSIIFDLNINQILTSPPANRQEEIHAGQLLTDVLRRNRNISTYLSSISIISDYYRVSSTSEHVDYDELQSSSWYGDFLESDEQKAYSGIYYNDYISRYNIPVFCLLRRINNPETGKCIGILVMEIKYDMIKHIFDPIHQQDDGEILVFNQQGGLMYHPDFNQILNPAPDLPGIFEELSLKTGGFTGSFEDKLDSISCMQLEKLSWSAADITPQSLLAAQSRELALYIGSIFFAVSILLLILILYLSFHITQPIKQLAASMKLVEEGHLDISVPVRTNDEIGLLGNRFNQMVVQINHLIDEVYQSESQKRDAELHALQAQINPHFLYNTLNTIRWMANMHGAEHISKAIISLVRLLEFSGKNTDEFVTIRQEIQHVKHYESLLMLRYEDKFTVEYQVSDELEDCYIPKFILQPIVENAVFHGIEPKEGSGIINITAAKERDMIHFSISDDGVGMDLKDVGNRKFSGIGIGNVNERLIRCFGETCGLHIDSICGKGTFVSFFIPLLTAPPVTDID